MAHRAFVGPSLVAGNLGTGYALTQPAALPIKLLEGIDLMAGVGGGAFAAYDWVGVYRECG